MLTDDEVATAAAMPRGWRDLPAVRRLSAHFAGLGEADAALIADRAQVLFTDHEWAREMLAPAIAALRRDPWAQPSLATSRDALRTGAVLFDSGAVVITASVVDAQAASATRPPASVIVPGRLTVVRYVKAGGARLHLWRAPPAGDDFSAAGSAPAVSARTVALDDGAVVRLDGRTHGWWLSEAARDLVVLTATIRAEQAALMRDYAIPSGALLTCATLDDQAARAQLLLTFLRVERCGAASDRFDAATRDPAAFLRWSAMREWLALDARAALPRLAELSRDDVHAEVRAAAAKTLAQITARHGAQLCPA